MATWNVVSGTWDTASNWAPASVPNAIDATATIANGGTAIISGGSIFTVGDLTIGTGLAGDTSNVAIAGDWSALLVTGSIVNHNTLSLNGAGTSANAGLRIAGSATVTLSGGGTVLLAGTSAGNFIFSMNPGNGELVNVDNTIAGSGYIGIGQMALDNQASGVIDANTAAGLTLQSNLAGFTNEGVIEATGGGAMGIDGGSIAQSSTGILLATGTGSSIGLYNGAVVSGGTLSTGTGGSLYTVNGYSATLSNLTISAASTYTGNDNSSTYLEGTIDNQGTLALNSGGNTADYRVAGGQTLTLTGSGAIVMGGSAGHDLIRDVDFGTGKLVNTDNIIEGTGNIGYGQMSMDNQTLGVIDANATGGLTLQSNGDGFTNEGLIEATGGGSMGIDGGSIAQSGGVLFATGVGSSIGLYNNAVVTGGTLTAANGGAIETLGGYTATLANTTLSGGSTYTGTDSSWTFVTGILINQGTIALASSGTGTELRFADGATLSGGGTIAMSTGQFSNLIFGVANNGTETATNLDNTIQGAGQIGARASIEFINEASGTVNATSDTVSLQITPATQSSVTIRNGGGFVNHGLLESTAAGGLVLTVGQFNNNGGTILAAGSGNDVYLLNGVTISGGLLASTGGGNVVTTSGWSATLDGSSQGALTLAGTYVARDNTMTYLTGVINNTSQFQQSSIGDITDLRIADGTTLTGGGTITLSDQGANRVWGTTNTGTEVLINLNNTIQGSGQFGTGSGIEFINQQGGTIDATGTAYSLVISPTTQGTVTTPNGGGFVNHGLLEATASAGLVLNNGQFNNNGGTILAAGSGNDVYLQNGVTVSGGLLTSTGGGNVVTTSGQVTTLDGSSQGSITLAGTYVARDSTKTYLTGAIDNTGRFLLSSTGYLTDVQFANGTTLTGGGTIALSDNPYNRILGITNSGTEVLTNLNNTIQGAGQLGASNAFGLDNSGALSATGVNALILTLSNSTPLAAALVNEASGVLQGAGAGGLSIAAGSVDNLGTIQALDGSSVTFGSGATNENAATGTLTGGTWAAISTGSGATLSATGGPISTDAAAITLSGAGAFVGFGDGTLFTDIRNSLTAVTAGGDLNVLNGADFSSYSLLPTFVNAGLVALGGGTFSDTSFDNTGTVSGFGTVTSQHGSALTNAGRVIASGGTLDFTGGLLGSGGITIDGGAALRSDGQLGDSQSVTFATAASAEYLILGAPQATNAFGIANWQYGDKIVFTSGATVTNALWLGSGTLEVDSSAGTMDFTNVGLAGGAAPRFTTGENFVELVACFAAGTRIRALRGDVPVENLHVGDTVLVHAGDGPMVPQPVVWIGYRSIDCRRHPKPKLVLPVRIRAGAFGPRRPARDLFLSPDHAVFIDDVLIPIKCLINDRTIAQVPVSEVKYFHVELAAHAVLLAEGLAVESYLDVGGRANFANGGCSARLHADFSSWVWEAEGRAPLIVIGPKLDAVRQLVNALAAIKAATPRAGARAMRAA